jgi:hypothetical protein
LRHSVETKKVGENVPELAVPNLQDVV